MLPCVLLETEKVKKALENGAGPVAFTDAGNILGVGAPLEHAVPQFETPLVVGESERVFLTRIPLETVVDLHTRQCHVRRRSQADACSERE